MHKKYNLSNLSIFVIEKKKVTKLNFCPFGQAFDLRSSNQKTSLKSFDRRNFFAFLTITYVARTINKIIKKQLSNIFSKTKSFSKTNYCRFFFCKEKLSGNE